MVLPRSHPAPPKMVRLCGCFEEHCKACQKARHWKKKHYKWWRRPVTWYTEADGEEYLREMTDSEISEYLKKIDESKPLGFYLV